MAKCFYTQPQHCILEICYFYWLIVTLLPPHTYLDFIKKQWKVSNRSDSGSIELKEELWFSCLFFKYFYDSCLIQGPPRPDIARIGLNINSRWWEVIYGLLLPLRQACCTDVHLLMIYGQGTAGTVAFLYIGLHASWKGHSQCCQNAHEVF